MSDVAVLTEGLSKRYRIGQCERYHVLRERVSEAAVAFWQRVAASLVKPSSAENAEGQRGDDSGYVWALKGVGLQIRQGEVVGIIGSNGAGKTTLLKILSRITEPTAGFAEIRGRVGSLLEVGTGFHPELTGRENIYLNAAILGMRRHDIERKFDQIVEFSGVEQFLDLPVKRYSSGMHVRLAFSVAAHLEPDILLVDEVLAVGDAAFQEKCLGRMSQVSSEGTTVLFVSHNMEAVLRLCTRALWIEQGGLVQDDLPDRSVRAYLKQVRSHQTFSNTGLSFEGHPGRRKAYDGFVQLTHCQVLGGDGAGGTISSGNECRIIIGYKAHAPLSAERANFIVTFNAEGSHRLTSCWSHVASENFDQLQTTGEVECRIPRLPLAPGRYALDVGCQVASSWSDFVYEAIILEVAKGVFYPSGRLPGTDVGQCLIDYVWSQRHG